MLFLLKNAFPFKKCFSFEKNAFPFKKCFSLKKYAFPLKKNAVLKLRQFIKGAKLFVQFFDC